MVAEHLRDFAARAEGNDASLPRFAVDELQSMVRCGDFELGFLRFSCRRCGEELRVLARCWGRACGQEAAAERGKGGGRR
ncbi:MAG: transposase zinc-binding domain-containing protein [Nannocystaceae bacterium]|nr:transposase zinc-binding domain-containing protein [Nannocystaceae bacterium]